MSEKVAAPTSDNGDAVKVESPEKSMKTTDPEETSEPQQTVEAIMELLSLGKRNLLCDEIPKAVNDLQEASRLLAKKYGETAEECAEAYFFYGKALLELVRMECGVLGNALKGVPEEDTEEEDDNCEKKTKKTDPQIASTDDLAEDEREKIADDVYDAMTGKEEEKKEGNAEEDKSSTEAKEDVSDEKTDVTDKKADVADKKADVADKKADVADKKADVTDKKADVTDKKADADVTDKEADVSMETEKTDNVKTGDEEKDDETSQDEEMEADDDDEEENKEEEEDISNIQVAWEMLDLARFIYIKKEDKEHQLKAAQAHLKLGELSIETENYERAIEDLKQCLEIQEKHLELDDRLLAETHYQLGLALSFHGLYDESIDAYRSAVKVIESKIEKLDKIISEKKSDKTDIKEDPVAIAEKEIKELKDILPDIKMKIEDVVEEKKNFTELKKKALEAVTGETSTGFGQSSTEGTPSVISVKKTTNNAKPDNITHLVRKKRKPEDEEEVENEVKKMRSGSADTATNGHKNGTSNGVANGHPKEDGDKKEPEKMKTKSVEDVQMKEADAASA